MIRAASLAALTMRHHWSRILLQWQSRDRHWLFSLYWRCKQVANILPHMDGVARRSYRLCGPIRGGRALPVELLSETLDPPCRSLLDSQHSSKTGIESRGALHEPAPIASKQYRQRVIAMHVVGAMTHAKPSFDAVRVTQLWGCYSSSPKSLSVIRRC